MSVAPSRLLLGRKLRGLTLVALGEAAELNSQTLSRYENGKQVPSSESLSRIAAALALPAEFFRAGDIDPVPLAAVSFRALTKTAAMRRDAALAAGEISIELADWLNRRFDLPRADVPSFSVDRDASLLEAESAAKRVRSYWDLGSKPIPNLLHLLESKGVRVFSLVQEVRDVDAFSFYKDGVPFIFIDTGKSAERQRFDAAHELAHLVMHQGEDRVQGREVEKHADRFAASFLMPREDVLSRKLRNASVAEILSAARRWKVSSMALTHRLGEMGLLTEWGYRSCCVELSKAGYRRGEPGSTLVPERSQVLEKVFAYLRSQGEGPRAIADDLNVSVSELNRHIFGLVPTIVNERSSEFSFASVSEKPHLSLVHGLGTG